MYFPHSESQFLPPGTSGAEADEEDSFIVVPESDCHSFIVTGNQIIGQEHGYEIGGIGAGDSLSLGSESASLSAQVTVTAAPVTAGAGDANRGQGPEGSESEFASLASGSASGHSVTSSSTSSSSDTDADKSASLAMVEKLILDNTCLKEQIGTKNDEIRSIISRYKDLLPEIQAKDAELRAQHKETKEIIQKLKNENSQLQSILSNQSIISTMTQEIELFESKLSSLTTQLQKLELIRSICAQQGENYRLKESIRQASASTAAPEDQELQAIIAEKTLFESQMNEYDLQFQSERKLRIELKEAKDALGEEFARLQYQLDEKENEIKTIRDSQVHLVNQHIERNAPSRFPFHSIPEKLSKFPKLLTESVSEALGMGAGARNSRNRNSMPGARVDDEFQMVDPPEALQIPLQCPICNKIFERMNTLVVHVDVCCNTDNNRPKPMARPWLGP